MFKHLWKALIVVLLFLPVMSLMAAGSGHKHPGSLNPFVRDSALFRSHAFDADGICICVEEYAEKAAPRIRLRQEARDYIEVYIRENGYLLDKIYKNGKSYLTTIETIFEKRGLPEELKYLAVIESKLKPGAVSGVGATGLWQFMPATARNLGLKVAAGVDERRNSYKSTVAAAKYLARLYQIYEDWLLVVAAYNCGPGGVDKAIKRSGSRDFWKLQSFLPLETRLHVKRFISTHYYYENHGSLVTLTREETLDHLKKAESFLALYLEEVTTDEAPVDHHPSAPVWTRFTAILTDQENIRIMIRK